MVTTDARGRSWFVNEPGGGPASRFSLWRAAGGAICRIRHDVPLETASLLEALARDEDSPGEAGSWPRHRAGYLRALGATDDNGGPAYRFPGRLSPAGLAVRLAPADGHLLRALPGYEADVTTAWAEREPRFVVIVDGVAVSICNTVRLTDRAAEAGVDTHPAHRGHGYAAMVVSAWAAAIRAGGREPYYSTSHDNAASQAVARKLGLIPYAAFYNVP